MIINRKNVLIFHFILEQAEDREEERLKRRWGEKQCDELPQQQ